MMGNQLPPLPADSEELRARLYGLVLAQGTALQLIMKMLATGENLALVQANLRHNRLKLQRQCAAGRADPSVEAFVQILEAVLAPAPEAFLGARLVDG